MRVAIWWVRRDLRLADNQALDAAVRQADQVIPLFILDPALAKSAWYSEKRMAFLLGGLRTLDADLRNRGSRLIIRQGEPATSLAKLHGETGATVICAEQDYSPYAKKRDAAIADQLPLALHNGVAARPVGAIHQGGDKPYTVFTPYSRRWKALPPITAADLLAAPLQIQTPAAITSLELPDPPVAVESLAFVPGEQEALRRLTAFATGDHPPIWDYAAQRDQPALAGTAQLSPYLRLGMVSARQAAASAYAAMQQAPRAEARSSAETWLNELIWRDFYITILHKFPHVRRGSFRREYDNIRWSNNEADFAAWCAGQTGYPIVDAAMRQLLALGWMHNRLRMIVASFLVKNLLIDWRWGERWFMQHLLDGDPAANNGGWQWTAGVGTDAAPYFRVFSPVAQGERFDPEGVFVHQWVPELRGVPSKAIHAPWTLPKSEQSRARCVIGVDYPAPIVDHSWARERVLAAFRAAK